MKELGIRGRDGDCRIIIGSGALSSLAESIGQRRAVIITDRNVHKLHDGRFPEAEVVEIGLGEGNKSLKTVERVYARLLESEMDRSCLVIGIGGGIVCDVAGFIASTYLRGMGLVLAPTTLLAQVDAGIGGKNGVNYRGYKNLVGTIRQPELVICDVQTLSTLPEDEMRNGYAEVVKHAAIGDAVAFGQLERNADRALCLGPQELERMVVQSAAVKARIVQADEHERGERMKLNFGHTIGHAIEKAVKVRHGEAVAAGMAAEAGISLKKGLIGRQEQERLASLLEALGLPIRIHAKADAVLDAIRKDKKRMGSRIRMPVLVGIGDARIADVSLEEMEDAIEDLR